MLINNSPVSQFQFNQRTIYVKRDDLLDPNFSGNKARKLAYFLTQPSADIDTLISYGGNQSNLMYSLSCLAKLKNWQFIYYTNQISSQAQLTTTGNLAASLANGMQIIPTKTKLNLLSQDLATNLSRNQLLIQQGGAQSEAEFGIQQLATEIRQWAAQQNFAQLAIFLPSGTGTSAFYLQKELCEFTVYTTNCVGSPEYLEQQFQQLDSHAKIYPTIFPNFNYRFATPHQELFKTYQQLSNSSQIEFDLVYDPIGWKILSNNLAQITAPLLYIHCGGLIGNSSMLKRYQYAFPELFAL
jgi:1-aminocyclopropane-1-carboxylate deaminase/D-cysteine desulfhydrase-like pyridoxal-dependent ACC family enzyme